MTNSIYNLDHIPSKILESKIPKLRYRFKKWVFCVIILDLIIISYMFFCFFYFYIDTGIFWLAIPKFIQIIRTILLISLLFMNVVVYYLRGYEIKYRLFLTKHFKKYIPLGLWSLIGTFDLVFRLLSPFITIIVLLATGSFLQYQTLLFLSLDLIYILEFYLSLKMIYNYGVIQNVKRALHLFVK
jgi:hypothetical protein